MLPLDSQFEKLLMHQAALYSHFMYINIQIILPNQIIKVNFVYMVLWFCINSVSVHLVPLPTLWNSYLGIWVRCWIFPLALFQTHPVSSLFLHSTDCGLIFFWIFLLLHCKQNLLPTRGFSYLLTFCISERKKVIIHFTNVI